MNGLKILAIYLAAFVALWLLEFYSVLASFVVIALGGGAVFLAWRRGRSIPLPALILGGIVGIYAVAGFLAFPWGGPGIVFWGILGGNYVPALALNAMLIHLAIDAARGRTSRVWLALPLAVYAGWWAYAWQGERAAEALQRAIAADPARLATLSTETEHSPLGEDLAGEPDVFGKRVELHSDGALLAVARDAYGGVIYHPFPMPFPILICGMSDLFGWRCDLGLAKLARPLRPSGTRSSPASPRGPGS